MPKITATWDLSLDCTCPNCEQYVDLTTADTFWERNSELAIVEHGTPRTVDMEVECPKCFNEFKVSLEY